MRRQAQKPATRQRTIGLDKPCRLCGQEIFYAYRGPVEGICGRCTDRLKTSLRLTDKPRTRVVTRAVGRTSAILIFLALVVGFVLGLVLHPHLPSL